MDPAKGTYLLGKLWEVIVAVSLDEREQVASGHIFHNQHVLTAGKSGGKRARAHTDIGAQQLRMFRCFSWWWEVAMLASGGKGVQALSACTYVRRKK